MKKLVNKNKLKQAIYAELKQLLQQGKDMADMRALADRRPTGIEDAEYYAKLRDAGQHMRNLQEKILRCQRQARELKCVSLHAAAVEILHVCSLHGLANTYIQPAQDALDKFKAEAEEHGNM